MKHRRDLDKFIEETDARQRNIVFPDTVRNGRSVDAFLWKGSPNPPLVQRIGARLLGGFYVFIGLAFFRFAADSRESKGKWAMGIISFGFIALGARVFRNGFPRKQ